MNWDAVGALAETFGAIAVVSTIAYLAIQIRDSRRNAELTAVDTVMSGWNQAIQALGESKEIASLIQRALADYNELEQAEKFVFHTRMDAVINAYFKGSSYDDRGLWDLPSEIETAVLRLILSPGGTQWWEGAGEVYPNRDKINQLLEAQRSELIPFSDTSFLSVERL